MESVIKTLREQHRYTQTRLAEELGISRQALIKYENLEQDMPLSLVRALSKKFSVSYDSLINNELPATVNEKDQTMLSQIIRNFPSLKEHEKIAVSEMVRLMAVGLMLRV